MISDMMGRMMEKRAGWVPQEQMQGMMGVCLPMQKRLEDLVHNGKRICLLHLVAARAHHREAILRLFRGQSQKTRLAEAGIAAQQQGGTDARAGRSIQRGDDRQAFSVAFQKRIRHNPPRHLAVGTSIRTTLAGSGVPGRTARTRRGAGCRRDDARLRLDRVCAACPSTSGHWSWLSAGVPYGRLTR